ncbi:MAG: glycosyl hydrolase [Bacteroidetes bacterium]|nr:MAG: glycosyl hydrolase [Bacteroidota bacterium]
MTLTEKIGQMNLLTSDWVQTGPSLRPSYLADIQAGRVGAIFNAHTADYTCELQRLAVEETRLGIPLLFGFDVVHGYKTIFPMPIGEAASWDLAAIEGAARISTREAAAAGLHWTFAPMVDIARDPRWGRMAEGAGEDTWYGNEVARARVRGIQGQDLADPQTLLACVKHYAAYGAAQAGRDYHTTDLSEQTLREVYLPPFQAAIEAGAATIMTAFNDLNGIPATGNRFLLDQILRQEWGFDGFVVTDYSSIPEMIQHGIVGDTAAAAALALDAGVDMDMQASAYYYHLARLVAEGKIDEGQIDAAVRRILRAKYALGLFDDPYRYCQPNQEAAVWLSDAHRAAARDIARKSLVLLRNQGATLPLRSPDRILLTGPLADSQRDMLGSWSGAGEAESCVTLKTGLETRFGAEKVRFVPGCGIEDGDDQGIAAAVRAARRAEVIVAAVGESAAMSGEAASRSELDLPGVQLELLQALKATGKPLVVVVFSGRALALPWLAEQADALVMAWFPGTEGGHALAEVLSGDYGPSGRLPVTVPRSVGQVPIFYNPKATGRPMDPQQKYTSKYLDVPNTPLFPFGYGLTYGEMVYEGLQAEPSVFDPSQTVTVSVTVTNRGPQAGTETVQLYVRDLVGSLTRPVRELKGFQQVTLAPGESRVVTFALRAEDLAFLRRDGTYGAEPGHFDLFIGPHAESAEHVRVKLVP